MGCSGTSPPRPSTSPSRTPLRPPLLSQRLQARAPSSVQTLPLVVLPAQCLFSSSTPLTTPEQGLPMTPRVREVRGSSMAWSMSTPRPSSLTASRDCTEDSHLRRRYLHLPWHVLRSLRHTEAHPPRRQRQCLHGLPPRMGSHRHCWTYVLPH